MSLLAHSHLVSALCLLHFSPRKDLWNFLRFCSYCDYCDGDDDDDHHHHHFSYHYCDDDMPNVLFSHDMHRAYVYIDFFFSHLSSFRALLAFIGNLVQSVQMPVATPRMANEQLKNTASYFPVQEKRNMCVPHRIVIPNHTSLMLYIVPYSSLHKESLVPQGDEDLHAILGGICHRIIWTCLKGEMNINIYIYERIYIYICDGYIGE